MHQHQLDFREERTRKLWHERARQSDTDDAIPNLRLFGDCEILCLVSHGNIQIWFFNPKFSPTLYIVDKNPFLTITR